MQEFLLEIINNYGYLGILFLIFLENIFPPIPSEAVLLFGGFLTLHTKMSIPYLIIFSTTGSILGAISLYFVGCIFTKQRLHKIVSSKACGILCLQKEHIDKAGRFFIKYESVAVLIGRFIPIVRSLISIPAGAARMNLPLFIALTTIGSFIWNSIFIYLGAVLGDNWQSVLSYMDRFTYIEILLFLILLIIFFLKLKIKKGRS